MTTRTVAAAAAFGAILFASQSAFAFECPKHFAAAQVAIDQVAADMKAGGSKVAKADMGLVHALLDDAKNRLSSGQHNHEKPQGKYDHARAMAKADAAKGYAAAAGALLAKSM